MNRRYIYLLGLVLTVMTFTMCRSNQASVPSTPEEALAALLAGNERYVDERSINPRSDMERVEEIYSSSVLRAITSTAKW